MTTFGRPGVYVQENIVQQSIIAENRSDAIASLVGVLPRGAEEPVLVSSWSEFTKTFGNLDYTYPTTVAAYLFFSNGGRDMYVRRVTGTGAAAAGVTLADSDDLNTLTVNASSKGAWGNNVHISAITSSGGTDKFSLVVYGEPLNIGAGATSNILEQFTELSMDPTNGRYAPSVINGSSAYISVTDLGAGTLPVLDAGLVALTSGANGSAVTANDLSGVYQDFDPIDIPIVFNLPDVAYWFKEGGLTADRSAMIAAYGDLLTYVEARGDGFIVLDVPAGYTASDASTFVSDVAALVSGNATGTNAAAYYPWLTIPDMSKSTPGATTAAAPGGAILGQYQATDTAHGVFKTPAGYNNRVAVAVGLETKLTNNDLDILNSSQHAVNAIRVTPGAGIVVMGGRTLANTSPNRYINMRRSLIYLKKELSDRSAFAVFENNDEALWNQITSALSNFLNVYWQQGGLRGATPAQAFYVKCDSSTTSQADISNGRVNIEVGVALEYPAEFISITIGQITGSASVVQG